MLNGKASIIDFSHAYMSDVGDTKEYEFHRLCEELQIDYAEAVAVICTPKVDALLSHGSERIEANAITSRAQPAGVGAANKVVQMENAKNDQDLNSSQASSATAERQTLAVGTALTVRDKLHSNVHVADFPLKVTGH